MKILLLAYYFPPDSSSGSFRPLYFANHLVEAGDEVIIVTARQEDFLAEQPVDAGLYSTLDHRVQVVRCSVPRPKEALLAMRDRLARISGGATRKNAVSGRNLPASEQVSGAQGGLQAAKDFLTDLLTTPDIHAGWIFSCVQTGLALIRKQRPDVILATGGPWSALVAGSLLKRLTKVPLALDFRDPWVSNPDHVRRGNFFRRVDTWIEKQVVTSADLVIANTEELGNDFLRRYQSPRPEWVVTITNGFENYAVQTATPGQRPLTLTHAGALYFSRNPRPLLEAVKTAIEQGRITPADIRLRFVGGIEVKDSVVAALLTSSILAQSIEVIQRVSFEEALRAMIESDVLLIYQPGFPLQVPRKLYDCMAVRKPLLCIAEPESATWALVERYGLGRTSVNDAPSIGLALEAICRQWQAGGLEDLAPRRYDPFLNRNLTARLRCHLERIVSGPILGGHSGTA